MSVLVKDMKMPENCIGCPMQYGGWCYVAPAEIDERVAPTVAEAWEQGKPNWCPLVEVPTPHGRLVDTDTLKEQCGDWYIEQGTEEGFIGSLGMLLDEAPALIEAEE